MQFNHIIKISSCVLLLGLAGCGNLQKAYQETEAKDAARHPTTAIQSYQLTADNPKPQKTLHGKIISVTFVNNYPSNDPTAPVEKQFYTKINQYLANIKNLNQYHVTQSDVQLGNVGQWQYVNLHFIRK